MPLTSQQGEVAERLRKFFRITGRIPSNVDETVVPVARVQALDEPPYRTTIEDFMGRVTKVAVVGRFSLCGCILRSPGVAVLHDIWIRNATAGALSFSLHLLDNGEADATFATPSFNFAVEHIQPIRTVPPELGTIDLAAVLVSNQLWFGSIPATTSIRIPTRVTIRRNRDLTSQGLWLQAQTNNTAVDLNVQGTYYPETI